MKLLTLLQNVERPPATSPWDFEPPVSELCSVLGVNEPWDEDNTLTERLQAYPIYTWMCTDEMVGLHALYFDDQPVASIYRSGRKCHYEIEWVSKDAAKAVRDFMMTFDELDHINLIREDVEIDVKRLAALSGKEA